MRASFIVDPEARRDLAGRIRRGRIAKARASRQTPELVSLRMPPAPKEFVTSPDGAGRRRLLERFRVVNRRRRAME